MEDNIEISPYGSLLVFKRNYTPEFVLETIKRNKLKGLRIFAQFKEERLPDLSFLKFYSFLEALDITSLDDYNFDFLKSLPLLKELSIHCQGNSEIFLGAQENLEKLVIKWRKKVTGFERCYKLNRLTLVEFKGKDLTPIRLLGAL